MSNQPRVEIARKQIEFARSYTELLLADIDEADWFTMPPGVHTHLAWQVGHLAVAQYGLALFRQRGLQPEDDDLLSSAFRRKFGKGSVPDPDPVNHPSLVEIREVFRRVYHQALLEMEAFQDAELDKPVPQPTMGYENRFGALLFCAAHEMMHAGQIGMVRRLLGKQPLR